MTKSTGMTVANLIEELKQYPQEWQVTIQVIEKFQDRLVSAFPVCLQKANLHRIGESVVITPKFK